MKIAYGIMETFKNRNLTNLSLNTWLKDDNIYIFTDKENNSDNRYIKITTRNDYYSNAIKCILGFKYLYENCNNIDFFVFIDNDTYINLSNLKIFLKDKKSYELKAFGSIINTWKEDISLNYLSGGAGIVLTNATMNHIYNDLEKDETVFNISLHPKYCFSDVTLGYHLKNNNIELINSDLFNSQPPEYYNYSISEIKNKISFHYINTIDSMLNLIKLL